MALYLQQHFSLFSNGGNFLITWRVHQQSPDRDCFYCMLYIWRASFVAQIHGTLAAYTKHLVSFNFERVIRRPKNFELFDGTQRRKDHLPTSPGVSATWPNNKMSRKRQISWTSNIANLYKMYEDVQTLLYYCTTAIFLQFELRPTPLKHAATEAAETVKIQLRLEVQVVKSCLPCLHGWCNCKGTLRTQRSRGANAIALDPQVPSLLFIVQSVSPSFPFREAQIPTASGPGRFTWTISHDSCLWFVLLTEWFGLLILRHALIVWAQNRAACRILFQRVTEQNMYSKQCVTTAILFMCASMRRQEGASESQATPQVISKLEPYLNLKSAKGLVWSSTRLQRGSKLLRSPTSWH